MFNVIKDGPKLNIFTYKLFLYKNIKSSFSYSTFGFAIVFDEGILEIIFLIFLLSIRKEVD